jgi:hypothetical protein
LKALQAAGPVDELPLLHLWPLFWEHIHLTGDYHWHANKRVAKGGFRPLRQARKPLARALACLLAHIVPIALRHICLRKRPHTVALST